MDEKHALLSFLLLVDPRLGSPTVPLSSRLLEGGINDSWFYSQLPELLHGLCSERSHETDERSRQSCEIPVVFFKLSQRRSNFHSTAHVNRHLEVTIPQMIREMGKLTGLSKSHEL